MQLHLQDLVLSAALSEKVIQYLFIHEVNSNMG
jgi:hypothetical protein